MLGLDEDLHQAVEKGSQPQEPFEKSQEHYTSHDGKVDDLRFVNHAPPNIGVVKKIAHILLRPWIRDGLHAIIVDCHLERFVATG